MDDLPSDVQTLDELIRNQTQESLHLDYKESPAVDRSKCIEISKDISSFANSDGGLIIYGVSGHNHLPVGRDSGVDHTMYSREWLEQVIHSNISPRIEGIRIAQILISQSRSAFAVSIPKSYRGPHQAGDKKYYRRFNFASVPMENYEIEDIRNRHATVSPLMNIDVELNGTMAVLVVENRGKFPARDVSFTSATEIKWAQGREIPRILKNGAKVVPPGRRYRFFYHTYPELVNGEAPSTLEIDVSYWHPEIGQRVNDVFYIDFMDFFQALLTHPDTYELGKTIKEAIDKLSSETKKVGEMLETLASIASPTGLELSLRSTKNLGHIAANDGRLEKLDPYNCDMTVFAQVLHIDYQLGWKLQSFFEERSEAKRLSQIEGMTDDLLTLLCQQFEVRKEHT